MEEWKVISDYPNYSVSNFGNVRNDVKNTLMTYHLKRGGYYQVRLSSNSLTKDFYIHHLVIKYFCDEKPNNLYIIDHLDRNRINNNINNLRWISRSGNGRNRTKKDGYSSKYSGVYLHQPTQKYLAQIRVDGKRLNLGYFYTEEEAGEFYNNYNNSLNL